MRRLFTEHPATVGESYFEHLIMATSFGARMCMAGIACLLHGIFPFLFEKTGSKTITKLHDCMVANRSRQGGVVASQPELIDTVEDAQLQ